MVSTTQPSQEFGEGRIDECEPPRTAAIAPIALLRVGGIAGWLASMVMGRNASMGIFLNIVVGCVGSVIGNWLSGPLFGVRGSVQEFSLTGLIIAFVGAVVLLGIFNLAQRKSIR